MSKPQEAVFIATIDAIRTRASTGDAIISLAIPIEKANQISGLMGKVGHTVGVAFAEVEDHLTKVATDGKYGKEAKALKLSSFFRTRKVWEAIGTDEEYLDWLRDQPCARCGEYDYIHDTGEKHCEAAHVRRVEFGAGSGIKPTYSAIPLCHKHHHRQHQYGEESIAPNDWWMKESIKHVENWAWEKLKKVLGYDSWKQVPPNVLYGWAEDRNLEPYLPKEYKNG